MHGIRDTTSPSAPLQDSFYPGIMEETAAACLCLPAATVVSTGAQGAQANSSLAITFFFFVLLPRVPWSPRQQEWDSGSCTGAAGSRGTSRQSARG